MANKLEISRDLAVDLCCGLRITQERALNELRALLAGSAPTCKCSCGMSVAPWLHSHACPIRTAAPVVERQAIGWITEDHLIDKSATTYDRATAERWRAKGWPVSPIYAEQPAPVVVVLDERAEFEKALIASAERFHPNLTRMGPHPDAEYLISSVQDSWEVWQARASLDKVKELNQ